MAPRVLSFARLAAGVSGTSSLIGGGNFWEGAAIGATVHLVNQMMHKEKQNEKFSAWAENKLHELSVAGTTVSDFHFDKRYLSKLPSWIHGGYGRTWVAGTTQMTNFPSFVGRRLGLGSHFGRTFTTGNAIIMFGTTIFDNVTYQKHIMKTNPSFQQVQNHYDNIIVSPAFWLYKRIEPYLIKLGK